jgi:hypothetical protein
MRESGVRCHPGKFVLTGWARTNSWETFAKKAERRASSLARRSYKSRNSAFFWVSSSCAFLMALRKDGNQLQAHCNSMAIAGTTHLMFLPSAIK